jgi:3-oxoacyl-[acyl-carrier protein] reductase
VDLSLKGKVAVVGGSSQGIGYAIAHLLAAEGAKVAVVARRKDVLDLSARKIIEETKGEVHAIQADIRKAEDCERIISSSVEKFGRLDILVNNDGAPPLGLLADFDDAAWAAAVDRNLMSVVRLSRAALPHLKKAGRGTIVSITALSALQPIAKFGLSVATWAGVIGFAKTLSLEVAADNITVNTICPGRIATGRIAKVFDEQAAELAKQVPLGRLGRPEEIAGLVAFLASPWGGYLTGATFHVDGGRRMSLL